MTKTKRGVGGSFTSCLIKHFVFVSCRECFVNTWIHYQVLWNQRTFIYIIYLFRIIPAIVRLLLHYDDDLVTRTDCGPEYAACATQHRDHGYMLDTCWIHAGYMLWTHVAAV